MINKIWDYMIKWQMICPEDRIVVGVSGGADSVCLVLVLLELQKKIDFSLRVVHVNHGLRGEDANQDELYVKELCEQKQIPVDIYSFDVAQIAKAKKVSIEEAGRIVRREAMDKVKKINSYTKIAMAHHKNDNAETLLMNLARGTKLKGMGGILPINEDVIRPLLCVERVEIESFLEEQGVAYCTDKSNEEDKYTRNKIRNHIISYMEKEINKKVVTHIDETIQQMQELQQYMEEQVMIWMEKSVVISSEKIYIRKREIEKAPIIIKNMLAFKCISIIAGQEKNITQIHIEQIIKLLERQVGKVINLPYGIQGKRSYEGIVLTKAEKEQTTNIAEKKLTLQGVTKIGDYLVKSRMLASGDTLSISQKTYTKWFDYGIIKNDLVIRSRRVGDYITIDKQGNTQKLKTYFINEKIPLEKRNKILLITEGSHVLWIVGYRMGTYYQVTEETKTILEVGIKLANEIENKKECGESENV